MKLLSRVTLHLSAIQHQTMNFSIRLCFFFLLLIPNAIFILTHWEKCNHSWQYGKFFQTNLKLHAKLNGSNRWIRARFLFQCLDLRVFFFMIVVCCGCCRCWRYSKINWWLSTFQSEWSTSINWWSLWTFIFKLNGSDDSFLSHFLAWFWSVSRIPFFFC